jgi:hypothetical protein
MATKSGRSILRIAPRPTLNRWRGAQLEFQQPLPCVNVQSWDFPTKTLNYISQVRSVERGAKQALGRGPRVEFQTPLTLRAPVAQVTIDADLAATGTGTGTFISAAEDAKAFSMTGTGTATFVGVSTSDQPFSMTGTGTATFVGGAFASGALSGTGTWAGTPRTNLVLRSQEIDDAAWTKLNTTITADATTAPDSSSTADKVVEAATNSSHRVNQTVSVVSGSTYTYSVYIKAAERTGAGVSVTKTDITAGIFATIDLTLGSITAAAAFGGAVYTSSSITSVGSGWYRVTLTGSIADTSALVQNSLHNPVGTDVYAGDGSSGAYFWGAQHELGAFASGYIPTTSAAVTAQTNDIFVSAAEDAKAFSMTGTGTAALVGASQADSALSATGTGDATFVGVEISTVAPFSMTGTGTATFVGVSQADSAVSATGTGTALFSGASTADSSLSATGIANVSFAGATTADAILAAAGTWTATFNFANDGDGAFAAAGTGTALLIGASDFDGTLSATGIANVDFVGEGVAGATDAALNATGTGTAAFVGAFDAAAQPEAPATGGGAGGSAAWREHYKGRKRKKKDALEELDELLLDLRGQIAPWQKAKAYEAEQALYRETLARGEALDASDTLAKIESEIVNLKELLAEIDEEEAIMLLLL